MSTATLHPSPVPTPAPSSPPTPPFPSFPRLSPNGASISRNASTSSSRSNATTSSSSSSLVAVPIRPPPIETRTAATTPQQLPSRPGSVDPEITSPTRSKTPGPSSRGIYRNGPRSRQQPPTPTIITSPTSARLRRERPNTAPTPEMSPTTPRGARYSSETGTEPSSPASNPIRVTVSMDPTESVPSSPIPVPSRGRGEQSRFWRGGRSIPSSPTSFKDDHLGKSHPRSLSVDREKASERERRQSQVSAASSGSAGPRKPSLKDFILGEELGRGSYSTVLAATLSPALGSPNPSLPPKEFAIKIINQAHLVAENKTKYAVIERNALIRLAQPQASTGQSTSTTRGHRRGMSNSSSGGFGKRKSNTSMGTTSGNATRRNSASEAHQPNRLSVATDASSSSSLGSSVPMSPTIKSSISRRRPSRSADPPEMVIEGSEESVMDSPIENMKSRPPSPVKEESSHDERPEPPKLGVDVDTPKQGSTLQSPDPTGTHGKSSRKRRQSLAPSERSVRSNKSGQAHPGVIRIHSTFNDLMSLYFVLDLAKNGEILGFLRKFGSFDVDSARYYSALLIDTIEFMHERGVIHRDLKPENILLDGNMRTKITDFGSAKIIEDAQSADALNSPEAQKRSFVGSADFVSPEVLRNEAAVFASDIWAFGCIVYQYLVGRPPFRAATDYLTFQNILKCDLHFPEGMDEQAKDLITRVLNLNPTDRPGPAEIKSHPFFSSIDFSTLWTATVPEMKTGLTPPAPRPVPTESDSDVWAVFDEGSDGGFGEEEEETMLPEDAAGLTRQISVANREHRHSPHYDHKAAAKAVRAIDEPSKSWRGRQHSGGSLEPPRFSWADGPWRKRRGWSAGSRKSTRTSSSSSANRTALSGLLETMGIHSTGSSTGTSTGALSGSSTLPSANVMIISKEEEPAPTPPQVNQQAVKSSPMPSTQFGAEAIERLSGILRENERVLQWTPVMARPLTTTSANLVPSFLLPASKRRELILTNQSRLIEIKDDPTGPGPRTKFEVIFNADDKAPVESSPKQQFRIRGDSRAGSPAPSAAINRFIDITEKGPRGFVVGTSGNSVLYVADSTEAKTQWMRAIKNAAKPS